MLLQAKNICKQLYTKKVFDHLSFHINAGEQVAIVGPSGSGKTTLLQILAGQTFYQGEVLTKPGASAVLVEQQHRFRNLSNTTSFYYQQRFNASDAEDAISVSDYLRLDRHPDHQELHDELFLKTVDLLQIKELMHRKLIQLSNGENKRVQLAKALQQHPGILLLDHPYTGLDLQARQILTDIFQQLIQQGITIIMSAGYGKLPGFITHVLVLEGGRVQKIEVQTYASQRNGCLHPPLNFDRELLIRLMEHKDREQFNVILCMKDVSVQYHEKQVLQNINWTVRSGERWALSGPNGAGKSTLLSLINADNPQAYANEIYLFDKRRGRGESIWDIKRRIGYVSPELHLYFEASSTVFNVVASGFFDTIGLFRPLSEEQEEKVYDWLQLLHIGAYARQLLVHLPLGIQRLALLARALVKNPPLLLLDEPAQGLDEHQASLFKTMIEQICHHTQVTLIYVSHYKEEIPECVTRFIHLNNGQVEHLQ